ncbi:MAG: VOC family protein [Chloroflexi bacterium]|nr:VOC family protein [Chloroflexota bacterium]MQC16984.1 hypothetical protein [Chloroflexota bacterium]MQC48029.1 hypothetical protein [Chloroflexota bacterium]
MTNSSPEQHGGIAGPAGVIIWTSDERYDALARFYVEQVGLTPDRSDAPRIAFTWGTPPDRFRLILNRHSEVSGMSKDPNRVMLNLLVWDIQTAYEGMTSRGVEFIEPPTAYPWGGWIATFRDPDGNTIQLLQPEQK